LANKLPCWLVSTQVIEAGVDIDFPTVFRAMGPLDSIVQAAGRCNREGKITDPDTGQRKLGEVIVFQPAEKGLPPGVYEMATGRAKTLLGEIKREQLANDPTLFALYFDELFSMIQTDTARKGGMPLQEERQAFNYRRVGERAKVIEDGGTAVLVPYKIAQKQIQKIRKVGWFDYLRMRKLQRFTVNLRRKDFLDLQSKGFITPLLPSCEEGPWVLDIASYHKNLGVHVLGQAAADFLNA
jgi:CRISPR-associated endonuclease/helicase Cas3